MYEEKAKLNKTATNDLDFLFVTYATDITEAVYAINNSVDYTENLGYNVQKLLGTNATVNAVQSCITNNNIIGMGNIGHGDIYGIQLSNGRINHDWFASQDLRGEIYFFNSCNVLQNPFKSSMLDNGGARTFIGGYGFLPDHQSPYVFLKFWDYTLNIEWEMGEALNQSEIAYNLVGYYDIKGDEGKLKLTTSGTLSRNEVWIKEMNVTGNLYVPAGKSLVFKTGSTVNLNGYSIISTGGTITRDAGVTINGLRATLKNKYTLAIKGLYPTILAAINASSSDYNVEIPNGTFNESFTVYGKNDLSITGVATLTGTQSFYWCNNLTIHNGLTAKQINAGYCNHPWFHNQINGSPSQTGISVINCTNFYSSGEITNCNTGINAHATTGSASGEIHNNNTSISSTVSSNLYVANAWFCNSITWDYSVTYSGNINSIGNYFAEFPVRVDQQSGGTYSLFGSLGCLQKISTGEQNDLSAVQIESDDPVETEFSKINASYFNLLKEIKEAKEKGTADNGELKNRLFNNANDFKNFIKKNPESSLSRVALTTAANIFPLYEDNSGMKNFLDEIINDKELASLKTTAENLMIDYHININDFDGAVSMADAFINDYKSDDLLLCEGLLKKGLILAHKLNQPEQAIECYSAIVNNYPDNPLAEFAKNELAVLGKDEGSFDKENLTSENPDFSSSSYPNPFNPLTTIDFSLPFDEKVLIKVYDILGREISELVNEFKTAGKYSVQFDGSNLSSGVYFYSITAGTNRQVKKMILSK